jgi:hypothetical protein
MPQRNQDPAEGPDKDARPVERGETEQKVPKAPSLLGPKGDPAEGRPEIGPEPN